MLGSRCCIGVSSTAATGFNHFKTMAEPFKNLLSPALIAATATHLRRAWRGFPREAFIAEASAGLDALEMKARAMQIAGALQRCLPADFDRAAGIVEAALAPATDSDDLSLLRLSDAGLAGWVVWPLGEWVARQGLAQPERALRVLHALTQRHTAEWAIRPFIVEHPARVFETLSRWTSDPSPHVRRLVSEGSRPRLPWGLQLKALIHDPSPTLPLLRSLQDDRSEYVRRSVANHLNDIAKDHPDQVLAWLHEHLPQAPAERLALLKHASRSLIKAGDAGVLKAWGLGQAFRGTVRLDVQPRRVRIGGELTLTIELQASGRRAQTLLIDYAVLHLKAAGHHSAKVFKGWQVELAGGEARTLVKRHSMREVTTRRYHAGPQHIELLINGAVVATAPFELLPAR